MQHEPYEFDVTITVKKRLWFSGPNSRELARDMLTKSLEGGMNVNVFAKIGSDGKPIEHIIGNDIKIEDA